ncbi:MAG: hypothetical protein BWY81_01001 [Firmicutes bacterium ADurb.Bin467]|nr:MAG: hypothetical protein BWY81_01001 [Firmicutes bacterium ADurb.Bin467]
MQHLRLREHRPARASVLGQVVVGEDHVLQKQRQLRPDVQFLRGAVHLHDAHHEVAEQLALARVVADHADLVGVELGDLAQVVEDHAGGEQVRVERRVDLADGLRRTQHRRDVMQKPRALGVVELLRGGVVEQLVARLLEPLEHQRLQFPVDDRVRAVQDEVHHVARGLRRAGRERGHVVVVVLAGHAQLVDAQLGLPVVFEHHAAHAQHLRRRRRGRQRVPHLGVDLAGDVRQRQIQVLAAVGRRALRRRAGQQVAVEHLPLDHRCELRLRFHVPSLPSDGSSVRIACA